MESDSAMTYKRMKQKYLVEKMKEHRFDQEEFGNFLSEQKEGGENIDNWEFDELIDQVERFRRIKYGKDTAEMIPNRFSFDSNQAQQIMFKGLAQDLVSLQAMESPKKDVQVVVQRVENKTDKFILRVLPQNHSITRKLADLNFLRSKLQIEFPYYYVG